MRVQSAQRSRVVVTRRSPSKEKSNTLSWLNTISAPTASSCVTEPAGLSGSDVLSDRPEALADIEACCHYGPGTRKALTSFKKTLDPEQRVITAFPVVLAAAERSRGHFLRPASHPSVDHGPPASRSPPVCSPCLTDVVPIRPKGQANGQRVHLTPSPTSDRLTELSPKTGVS